MRYIEYYAATSNRDTPTTISGLGRLKMAGFAAESRFAAMTCDKDPLGPCQGATFT